MRRYFPERNESGNSFIMYVMMMLLMLGIFGLGVDTAVNVYTRNAIQSALDTATRTAAQQTTISNGRVVIDPTAARQVAEQTYTRNRPGSGTSGGGVLVCQNTANGCHQTTYFRVSDNSQVVEFRIRERRNNLFLNLIGMDQQTFEITSVARFTSNLEQR